MTPAVLLPSETDLGSYEPLKNVTCCLDRGRSLSVRGGTREESYAVTLSPRPSPPPLPTSITCQAARLFLSHPKLRFLVFSYLGPT